jgi:beta-glucosidase
MLYLDKNRTPQERARDLLSRMDLREKAGQLAQKLFGFRCYSFEGGELSLTEEFKDEVERCSGLGTLYGLYRADPWSKRGLTNGLSGANARRAYDMAQRWVMEHSRFGIPMLLSSECPHGHQALDGYLLPVNLAAGAAWNPELLRSAYRVCGEQLKELGVDFSLMSMLDMLRDPRWGRSEECYSEDPCLSAAMARAALEGCQSQGVVAVAKHFCAQGETTGGVNASAARIGPRELREIHLPVMKACCEAGAGGVMAAYNEIDGVFCHANRELLQDILRGELGFAGLVMADGIAIDRLDQLTGSSAASGALALSSGVDVGLWDEAFSHLEEAVRQGLVPESVLDKSVLRVLELKFRRGLFEKPYLEQTPPKTFSYESHPESLELSRQSPVLLKNDGVLPLKAECSIAVIGPNAACIYNQLGDYTPAQRPGTGVTLLEGLRQELGREIPFEQGCTVCGGETDGIPRAVELAKESDVVVLALGGSSSRFAGAVFDSNGAAVVSGRVEMDCGEGVDSPSLTLPGAQEELAERIFALGKPVVTVVIAGRPYAIPEICERSQAVVYAFYPGPMGGKALAEILLGKLSPSGRLPASLPKSAGHLPCYYNYKSSAAPPEVPWLYPFGYGLSYTSFAFSELSFPKEISVQELRQGKRAEISFTVENTGGMGAYAVPQLFLKKPYGSIVHRAKELKAFEKFFVPAGEKLRRTLTLDKSSFSFYGPEMRLDIETGEYHLMLEEGGTVAGRAVFYVTE